jgi:hypothetical protein
VSLPISAAFAAAAIIPHQIGAHYLIAGYGNLGVTPDHRVVPFFSSLRLFFLEFCESVRLVLLAHDTQALVHLLQKAAKLLGESLINYGVQLRTDEVVRVREQYRTDHVFA